MTEISIFSNKKLTMTSLEISELVNSNHPDVRRSIERLAERGIIQHAPTAKVEDKQSLSPNNKTLVYLFSGESGKRDSIIVVAQLSPEFTARLVDRWQELENANQFKIPQTRWEALRLAADQAEVIDKQQRQIEQAKPAVQFLENYVEARSTKSLREVAKVLGQKEREFIAKLSDDGIIFKQSGNWYPHAQYHHRGLFEVKTGEANGHAFNQTRFTPEGIAWIARRFGLAGDA
jgi:phage regulator Rha-like protein